jgi:Protein of unknown function (DUF2924)
MARFGSDGRSGHAYGRGCERCHWGAPSAYDCGGSRFGRVAAESRTRAALAKSPHLHYCPRQASMALMTRSKAAQVRSAPESIGSAALCAGNLHALTELNRRALHQLWSELIGSPLPPQASQSLLVYGLAYRIQENAYGGLSAAARTRLGEIAGQLASANSPPARA